MSAVLVFARIIIIALRCGVSLDAKRSVFFAHHDRRIPSDLRDVWFLVTERPAWIMVKIRRIVGSVPLWSGDENNRKRSLAQRSHDRERRLAAKQALKYPPVRLNGIQARAVGRGFANYLERTVLPVWACAIHLVVGRPLIPIEHLAIQLKGNASAQLNTENIHPMTQWKRADGKIPKCFVRGQWCVYLDDDDILRAIRYVRGNPLKEEKPEQRWSFITEYLGS